MCFAKFGFFFEKGDVARTLLEKSDFSGNYRLNPAWSCDEEGFILS